MATKKDLIKASPELKDWENSLEWITRNCWLLEFIGQPGGDQITFYCLDGSNVLEVNVNLIGVEDGDTYEVNVIEPYRTTIRKYIDNQYFYKGE